MKYQLLFAASLLCGLLLASCTGPAAPQTPAANVQTPSSSASISSEATSSSPSSAEAETENPFAGGLDDTSSACFTCGGPPTSPQLTQEQQDELLESIRDTVNKYRTGEYPQPIVYGTDGYINTAPPINIGLPSAVEWDDLAVAATNDEMAPYFVSLSLAEDYVMDFYCHPGAVHKVVFRDLREPVTGIPGTQPHRGTWSDYQQNRLETTVHFTNYSIGKIPEENTGSLQWDAAAKRLVVQFNWKVYDLDRGMKFDYFPGTNQTNLISTYAVLEWSSEELSSMGKECISALETLSGNSINP